MRILCTGHSGLLGSHLVTLLKEEGHEVYGVSRTDRMGMIGNVFLVNLADLNLPSATEFVFEKVKPDVVYHLAANAAEAKGQVSPVDMVSRNLLLSTNVLRYAIQSGVKKFIYASSVSVYGDAPVPYTETSQPQPKDIYGVNKLAFEQELKIMAEVYGFDYTIFRPHNLYGPGQNPNDLTKNVVNMFMRKILLKEPYTILGDGSVRRGFSYAPDVAEVFSQAVHKFSGVTMNVGSKQITSIEHLSSLLQQITASKIPVERKPLRKQEIDLFIADHEVQDKLASYYNTPLEEGLAKTWDWMKKQDISKPIEFKEEICLRH
ncbi:MAG: NAD(P)-dependent oxidoreductase [bacterium]|nr:NAD(P)-dependent oxidoreductase [bacterium]